MPVRKSVLFSFGLVVAVLVALGLVVLSSASVPNGVRLANDPNFFFKRQLVFLAIGLCAAVAAAWTDYTIWRRYPVLAILLFAGVIALTCAVFLWPPVKGSHRWIPLGPVRLQPSELAKIATVIVVSVWVDRLGYRIESFWRGAFLTCMLFVVIAAPVIAAPDFGSTVVILGAGALIAFLAGVRFVHLLGLLSVPAVLFVFMVLTNGNRRDRLMSFASDMSNSGSDYQVYQALVAIANGGFFGRGLNESMQKHLYLPEAHTDFVFAVGAEEFGLVFTLAAIALFSLFFAFAVHVAKKATCRFGRYLAFGMGFLVFFQAMFNLGVVSRALPTKGMALPFFSYGGTNLVCAFVAVGIIFSVAVHSSAARRAAGARRTSA